MGGGGGGGGGHNIMHWYNDHQRRLVAALSAKSTSPLQTTATDSPSLLTKLAPLALIHHHVLGCTQAASEKNYRQLYNALCVTYHTIVL